MRFVIDRLESVVELFTVVVVVLNEAGRCCVFIVLLIIGSISGDPITGTCRSASEFARSRLTCVVSGRFVGDIDFLGEQERNTKKKMNETGVATLKGERITRLQHWRNLDFEFVTDYQHNNQ